MSLSFGPSHAFGIGTPSRMRSLYCRAGTSTSGARPQPEPAPRRLSASPLRAAEGHACGDETGQGPPPQLLGAAASPRRRGKRGTSSGAPASAVPALFRCSEASLGVTTSPGSVVPMSSGGRVSPLACGVPRPCADPLSPSLRRRRSSGALSGSAVDREPHGSLLSPSSRSGSPFWDPARLAAYKAAERAKAVAGLSRFYRCNKDACCMNLLDLQPPSLVRQQAFVFKESVKAVCPVCGDEDDVVIYY